MFLCMGTKCVKLEPEMSFESLPRQEVDPKRVGDVYVLAYSCGISRRCKLFVRRFREPPNTEILVLK